MKILGNVSEVLGLEKGLSRFISTACPWIHDNWNPEQIGWIFILDDDDLDAARSLNITPHIRDDPLIIDLVAYDLFEAEPIYEAEWWNLIGIVGQEYGFCLFIADSLFRKLGQKENI